MSKFKLYLVVALIAGGLGIIFYQHKSYIKNIVHDACNVSSLFGTKGPENHKTEHWITVFVHGSFGSVLSFLSMSQVLNDNLKGSLYGKLNKKMRKNPIFYRDQPMIEKGFNTITPTFDLTSTTSDRVAYPIIKAYESILETTHPHYEKNYFYMFGWTGLMSQYRRRYEAIRLYNHLAEEIEKFKRQGITPKIRLIAHSHGGNVCLNLAAINRILHTKEAFQDHNFSQNPDENESIKQMLKIMSQFPNKESAAQKKGQKKYNYVPQNIHLTIDELILFGTPMQAETASFVLSNMFKSIYNIYSEEDVIQQLDVLTTKSYAVNQRVKPEILNLAEQKHKITQVKIMYGRNFHKTPQTQPESAPHQTPEPEPESFWSKILSLGISFSKKSNDPTHKELWFITWKDKVSATDFCLAPLPTLIFTPVILKLLKHAHMYSDIDINIALEKDIIEIQLLKHDQTTIEQTSTLPLELIESIKKNIEKWKPDDLSGASEFDAISQHLM